jgi:predicted nucleotidyltransferase
MNGGQISLTPDQTALVRGVLRAYAPRGTKVRVFGSRATGTARHGSDLDLSLDAGRPLTLAEIALLDEHFDESSLPWKVDLVDFHSISPAFRAVIERGGIPFFDGAAAA